MIRRTAILLALFGLTVTSCVMDRTREPAPDRSVGMLPIAALTAFDECDALLDFVKAEAMERVGPYGLDGAYPGGDVIVDDVMTAEEGDALALPTTGSEAAPKQEGEDFSGTNNQEAGVDEADLVKTDGDRVVVAMNGQLYLLDTTTDAPTIIESITLPAGYSHELFLQGDRVLVIGEADQYAIEDLAGGDIGGDEIAPSYDTPTTMLVEVDISGQQSMDIVSTQFVEGSYLSSRAVDGTARIVLTSPTQALDWVQPTGPRSEDAAERANRELIEESTIDDWLPSVTTVDDQDDVTTGPIAPCDQVSRPAEFSGFGSLTVLTVDLAQPLGDTQPVTIMADGETVYASPDTLYVATSQWVDPEIIDDGDVDQLDDEYSTAIHSFDITGDGPAAYQASGRVQGHLLDQFALSENDHVLRVASTDGTPWGDSSESHITTFEEADGELQQVGQVGDMGHGEEIFAVRFIGDTAYVVTFEQTDPLYTVDLSDPAHPTVVGELEIQGYSAYLHPVDDGLLLGVGQDATETGATLGTQVSLFDVSDPANPTRLQQYTLAESSSDVEYDHRAFLWWGDQSLAVLPVQDYLSGFAGAIGLDVGTGGITERGRISHGSTLGGGPSPCPPDALCTEEPIAPPCPPDADCGIVPTSYSAPIVRSLVVDDQVWTISSAGVAANDLVTLANEGFVSF